MKAFLILEDGTVFCGSSIGSRREQISEIVAQTAMTGYLEVLTDPSYAGQSVAMTYPLIGNYGVTPDMESARIWAKGFIVRELSETPSNFRCQGSLGDFLAEQNVTGIRGIDTRALAKRLREKGTMNGMITTDGDYRLEEILPRLRAYRVGWEVCRVTCPQKYRVEGTGPKAALLDLGTKESIVRSLAKRGCQVTVYPADTPAEEMLSDKPDGIVLSNGPGNPEELTELIGEIRKLCASGLPVFAVCLGHQLVALANGARTYRMKYGHRGGNHPVKELRTGRVYISSQNHGYAVDAGSMDPSVAEESFVNVNDGTNEGLVYRGKRIVTVQFHPEACPGPEELSYLFDRFTDEMKGV